MAMLLSKHGFQVFTVENGYQGFRQWAQTILETKPQKVCVIGGATGSGKTEVLHELKRQGLGQIIDLEGLASHKGSVFGSLGQGPQPSSEQMRNLLAMEWSKLNEDKFVFLEDEGSRIGDVALPAPTYLCLRTAPLVLHLEVPFDMRVDRSLQTYAPFGIEALCGAVSQFRIRLGAKRTEELLSLLRQDELRPVCEAALRLYDKAYENHLNKNRLPESLHRLVVSTLDSASVARDVAVAVAPLEEAAPKHPPNTTSRQQNDEKDSSCSPANTSRIGQCFCGAVKVHTIGDPVSVSICHCTVCRRLSGAPFAMSALFKPSNVRLEFASEEVTTALVETRTSRQVLRQRCAKCFSPIAGQLGQRFVALPVSAFCVELEELPEAWRPQLHLHYDNRIIDVGDNLVKYRNRRFGPVWFPVGSGEDEASPE